jgi:hypothetical protein
MICTICDRDLEIPDDAILIRTRFGKAMYLFPGVNGLVHEFKIERPAPKPPKPVEQIELLQEVLNVLTELPPPAPALPKPEPVMAEFETEPEQPETAMAAAFKRSRKS